MLKRFFLFTSFSGKRWQPGRAFHCGSRDHWDQEAKTMRSAPLSASHIPRA